MGSCCPRFRTPRPEAAMNRLSGRVSQMVREAVDAIRFLPEDCGVANDGKPGLTLAGMRKVHDAIQEAFRREIDGPKRRCWPVE